MQQKKRRIYKPAEGVVAECLDIVKEIEEDATSLLQSPQKNRNVKKKSLKTNLCEEEKNKSRKKIQVIFSVNKVDNEGKIKPAKVERIKIEDDVNEEDILESDDEGERNRVGNVPMSWYDPLKHVGYTLEGEMIKRTLDSSAISRLLNDADNPDAWKEIVDLKNQTITKLTNTDIEIINRLKKGVYPHSTFDMCGPDSVVEFDNPEAALHPTYSSYPPKRRFMPSLSENKRINLLVKLIRQGKIRTEYPKIPEVYDIWGSSILTITSDSTRSRIRGPPPLPAPKQASPDHSESYNPPDEYLPTPEEKRQWLEAEPQDRETKYLPTKSSCLRRIIAYPNNIVDRFERCLDLYLCPRALKMRINIDPASMLPQLPNAMDLRPFPTRPGLTFDSANDSSSAMCLSFDATGSVLAVGRKNGVLDIFDVASSRLIMSWDAPGEYVDEPVYTVSFNSVLPLLAMGKGSAAYIIELPLEIFNKETTHTINDELKPYTWDLIEANKTLKLETLEPGIGWKQIFDSQIKGWRIEHAGRINHISWHCKGLYFVTICNNVISPSQQLGIHSLKQLKTLRPFKQNPGGKIQRAEFHPTKSWLYVAYYKGVRLYNLEKSNVKGSAGSLLKKFTNVDHVNDMHIHPSGDHIIVGGGNKRLTWFDYDLGEQPFKILRYHKDIINTVGFHNQYPLMFSGCNDGMIHIFHAKVSTDLITAPTIIPVKKIDPATVLHKTDFKDAILDCIWHPSQPWLAAAMDSGQVAIFV